MKLCCIEHYRCDSTDAYTYVWCEDDWTEDQFEEAVERAEKAYNASLKAWSDSQSEDPYPRGAYTDPDWKKYPDLKVSEVLKLHEEKKAEREAWKSTKDRAHRSFSRFLEDEGLVNFYSVDAEYETTIWWGHRHGERLDYEDTAPHKFDLKEKEELRSVRRLHRTSSV